MTGLKVTGLKMTGLKVTGLKMTGLKMTGLKMTELKLIMSKLNDRFQKRTIYFRRPTVIYCALTASIFYISNAGLTSCGANPFKSREPAAPAEDATIAMENNDPQKAIDLLETALTTDSSNWQYVSILAMAYAERAGLDALTVAEKMATSATSSSSSTSTNSLVALFSVMPAATTSNISDVDKALSLMITIPSASRTAADVLKTAMFQTASLTLKLKKYDTNGDGIIEPSEALAMSAGDAATVITQLASAAAAFSGGTIDSATAQAAASQVTAIQTAITACPGATQQAQLQNYISKTGC